MKRKRFNNDSSLTRRRLERGRPDIVIHSSSSSEKIDNISRRRLSSERPIVSNRSSPTDGRQRLKKNGSEALQYANPNRVRLHHDGYICVICRRKIEGRKRSLGNNVFRCYDCFPGSPSWMESEVGKRGKYRRYFLLKCKRVKNKEQYSDEEDD